MPTTIEQVGGTGILIPDDLPALNEAVQRVLRLMQDGQWHESEQIIAASQQREGLRRMRELRRGFIIERRRNSERRDFDYRLVEKPKSQQGVLL